MVVTTHPSIQNQGPPPCKRIQRRALRAAIRVDAGSCEAILTRPCARVSRRLRTGYWTQKRTRFAVLSGTRGPRIGSTPAGHYERHAPLREKRHREGSRARVDAEPAELPRPEAHPRTTDGRDRVPRGATRVPTKRPSRPRHRGIPPVSSNTHNTALTIRQPKPRKSKELMR